MKKRTGFTLIELLGALVILGMIVLIIAPMFIGTMTKSKKNAFKNTVDGMVRAIRLDSTNSDYSRSEYVIKNSKITYQDEKIDTKGSVEGTGTAKVDSDGNVTITVSTVDWCAIKSYKAAEVVVDEVGDCPTEADKTGANTPELSSSLVPIKWDATKSLWVKADEANYSNNTWYNYELKQWANAVSVTNASRAKYREAAVGTVVNINDIVGFFVWIPKYRYKLFVATGPQVIDIVMDEDVVKDNTYITHPAFRFSGKDLNGFWMAKFETTGKIDKPTILPNSAAITGEKLRYYFDSARNISAQSSNSYGFNKKNVNSHMVLNTEWAAVAYLSHSKYGKGSEVASNTNASGLTGGGNYQANVTQSTSGNITGVYDMAGGVWDYVMANNNGAKGLADFTTMPESKYMNEYVSATNASYTSSITGDAIKELAPFASYLSGWYQDTAIFMSPTSPWLVRGGYRTTGTGAGVFSFNSVDGSEQSTFGYRIAVTRR